VIVGRFIFSLETEIKMFGKWGGKHLIENLCERWTLNNTSNIGGRNECLTSALVQMLRIDIGVKLFRGGLGSVWRLRYCHSHGVGRGEAAGKHFIGFYVRGGQ
jgi:hypothetical protein